MAFHLLKVKGVCRLPGRLAAMRSDEQLDICRVAVPYCLLMVKSTLTAMKPGTLLEVQVSDPDSISDLLAILARSGDQILAQEQCADHTSLLVRKGPDTVPEPPVKAESATNG